MTRPFTPDDLGTLGAELQRLAVAVVPEGPLGGLRRVVDALRRVLPMADLHAEVTLARWGRDLLLRVLRRPAWSAHHPEARRLGADLVRGLADRAASEIAAVRGELVELLHEGQVLPLQDHPDHPHNQAARYRELLALTPAEITIVLLGRALRKAVDLNSVSLEALTGLHTVRIAVGLEQLRGARLLWEAPSPEGPLPILALVHNSRPSSPSVAHPSDDGEGGAPSSPRAA